jgi:hypothetical protein
MWHVSVPTHLHFWPCSQKRQHLRRLMFMSVGRDYVSELPPPLGLLSIPQMMYECGEPRWNDTDRETSKKLENNLALATLSAHPTWPDPTANPGPPRRKAVTKRLSHGTAFNNCCCWKVRTMKVITKCSVSPYFLLSLTFKYWRFLCVVYVGHS